MAEVPSREFFDRSRACSRTYCSVAQQTHWYFSFHGYYDVPLRDLAPANRHPHPARDLTPFRTGLRRSVDQGTGRRQGSQISRRLRPMPSHDGRADLSHQHRQPQ